MKKLLLVLVLLSGVCNFIFPQNTGNIQNSNSAQSGQNGQNLNNSTQESSQTNNTSDNSAGVNAVDLGTIVIGATRYGISLRDMPYDVSIVTRRDIENYGAVSIIDALKYTPGVTISPVGGGGYDTTSGLRIRNGNSKETVVLINGIRIINNLENAAYFGSFGAEMFERIEIMKGNGSLIYGPDGVRGAVNLVTRDINKGSNALIGFQYGHGGLHGLLKVYTNASYGMKNFHIFGSVSYLNQNAIKMPSTESTSFSDKVKGNSDSTLTNGLITFGFKDNDKTFYIDFLTLFSNRKSGSSGPDSAPDLYSRFSQKDYLVAVSPGAKIGKLIQIKSNIFFNHSKYHDYERNIAPSTYPNDNDDIFKMYRYGFDITGILKPFKKFIVTLGINQEFRRVSKERTYDSSVNIGPINESLTGVYLQLDYSISIVQMIGGIRMDYHKSNSDETPSHGTMFSPSFALLVSVFKDYLKVRGQVSRIHRLTDVTQTYFPTGNPVFDSYNPDLNPEKSWVFEGGIQSNFKKFYYLKATLFYYKTEDRVVYSMSTFKLENISNVSTIGFEVELVLTPISSLNLPVDIRIPVNFTYQKDKDLDTDEVITNANNNKYTLNFGVELLTKFGLTFGVMCKYVRNWDAESGTNYDEDYLKYFLLDANINYRFKAFGTKIRMFINFINILNTKYSVIGNFGTYTMPGFSFIAGLEAKF